MWVTLLLIPIHLEEWNESTLVYRVQIYSKFLLLLHLFCLIFQEAYTKINKVSPYSYMFVVKNWLFIKKLNFFPLSLLSLPSSTRNYLRIYKVKWFERNLTYLIEFFCCRLWTYVDLDIRDLEIIWKSSLKCALNFHWHLLVALLFHYLI